MSELKERVRADLATAMKAKDEIRRETLRMVLASVIYAESAGDEAKDLTDQEFLAVLAKEVKKRNEAAAVYDEAGRGELAERERAEAAVIEEYLPQQLSDAELDDVAAQAVAQVAAELGDAPGMRQMGQVMKVATALAAGRADGKRLSAAVKGKL